MRTFGFVPILLLIAGSGNPVSSVGSPESPGFRWELPACEVPIRWRIAEVDPRFGLTEEEAAQAVRQAGMLWEEALGRVLLFQESSEGIPIRFIYDERQQATQERQAGRASIDRLAEEIEMAEAEVESLRSQVARQRIVHESRVLNYEELAASYRELVEYWNPRGGAPPAEIERLEGMETEIDSARESANESANDVNLLVEELNSATDDLNRRITEANRARTEFEERYPTLTLQSGQYIDTRTGLGRLTFSREREIRVFQYEDGNHLLLVIAHELGHALGLEHTGVEGTLMAEASVAVPGQARPQILPADVEELRAVCPEL